MGVHKVVMRKVENVFFICDWDYTLLWDKIAKDMINEGHIKRASALVAGGNFYNDLIKTKHCFSEVHFMQKHLEAIPTESKDYTTLVKTIEKKYNADPLWRFIWADRSWRFESYENSIKRLVACFEYFEALYSKEKPDLILANAYASMPHLISYMVATKMSIKIVRPLSARLGKKYFFSYSEMEDEPWIDEYLNGKRKVLDCSIEQARAFVAQFRNKSEKPFYQAIQSSNHKIDGGHVHRLFRYFYQFYFTKRFEGDHTKKNPFKRIIIELKWRLKRSFYLKTLKWDQTLTDSRFCFFPLHVQPEMSTMTYAPFYLDQLTIIENVAKSLPVDMRLVVKEHPSMIGKRGKGYYERLKQIPNVLLISPAMDSHALIKKSSFVFTITGTAGLEGLLFGKNVISLGSVYWSKCPLIINGKSVAPTLWRDLVQRALTQAPDDETLVQFLATILENSYEGVFVEPLMNPELILAKDNLDILKDQIIKDLL